MQHEDIVSELLGYLYATNPVAEARKPLPLDESLHELGILDSFAVIELVGFIEDRWSIPILDSEITREKFGGINKMARLILEKTAQEAVGAPSGTE